MENKRFFFILGMPRTRTAWLSVLLTHGDTFCFHEGTSGFNSVEDYAKALRERSESCVGDANPSLVFHIDFLLREFPDARFLFVRRPSAESLESLCAEAPEDAEAIRAGWNGYLAAFEAAAVKAGERKEIESFDFTDFGKCWQAVEFITGHGVLLERFEQLSKLRIVSNFPPVKIMPPLSAREVVATSISAPDGFDFTGLSLAGYSNATDRQMVCRWFAEHKEAPMPDVGLPPLGVVVSDAQGPCAALWCFETYGTGVAWIELPVTRPGLSLREAENAIAFAILGITQIAGKSYEPPAVFRRFRACCPPAMARTLKHLGFIESEPRANLLLNT
jgi:hypothetical protein